MPTKPPQHGTGGLTMADLIDREALMEHIEIAGKRYGITVSGRCNFREIAKEVPSADAAPVVHAKWVVNTDDFTPKKRCTNCGYNKPMKAGEGIEQEPEAFCPSCGATMDENGGNSQ